MLASSIEFRRQLFFLVCIFLALQWTEAFDKTNVITHEDVDIIEDVTYTRQSKQLAEELQANEDVQPISYVVHFPTKFTVDIIFDPCRNLPSNCCHDAYGYPNYVVKGTDVESISGTSELVDADGVSVPFEESRQADRYSTYDPQCYMDDVQGPYRSKQEAIDEKGMNASEVRDYNDPYCTGKLSSLTAEEDKTRPPCWDYNNSVNALADCYAVDGLRKSHCVTVGYLQTAYIVQCGRQYAYEDTCGTFLEIHKSDDPTILSQTRLLSEFASGFRVTTISFHYKGDKNSILCQGDYEIWFVQRVKTNYIVRKKKKFRISSPKCDLNLLTNSYSDKHTL